MRIELKCFECDSKKNVEKHHVVPKSRGGKRTIPLCRACHDLAHDRNGRNISVSRLTKDALRKKKINGERTGGREPYGFRTTKDGRLLPLKKEQRVIKWMIIERVSGKTYRAIAGELERKKIPAKCSGKRWHPNTVSRILKREN